MKIQKKEEKTNEIFVSLPDFLNYYNKNLPEGFPKASASLLEKFKDSHSSLFKKKDLWSPDQHRKKIMDWLPLNSGI